MQLFKLVNYQDHPSNNTYIVFDFFQEERANYFEQLLKENNVYFERDQEETRKGTMHLFGVNKDHKKLAHHLNNLAAAKYRKPTISSKLLQYSLYIFMVMIAFLAVMGYVYSK